MHSELGVEVLPSRCPLLPSLLPAAQLSASLWPGHYRRETSMIYSSAIVRLTSQLRSIPPGGWMCLVGRRQQMGGWAGWAGLGWAGLDCHPLL